MKKAHPKIIFISLCPFGTVGYTGSFMISTIVSKRDYETYLIINDAVIENLEITLNIKDEFKEVINLQKEKTLLQNILQILNEIKRIKPDIVHVFYHSKGFLIPTIWNLKNPFSKYPKWLIDIRSQAVLDKKRSFYKKLLDPLKQIGFDIISAQEFSSAKSQLGTTLKPVFEVPPGVNFNYFKKPDYSKQPSIIKCKKLLYVGAITKTRKIDFLVNIIANVKSKLPPSENFVLDLYGDGDLVDNLKIQIKDLGLEDVVFYKGVITQEELFKKMANYDLGLAFVPYDQFYNAPPLKTLEYMAADMFVIGSDTAGNMLYVTHDKSGILVKNEIEAMGIEILNAVITGLPLVYKQNAYLAAKEYDWDNLIDTKLIPNYKKLLEK